MNLNNAKYELTAVRPDQYPKSEVPEIAFAGRSNVGKSSFINALLNRKNLARVGATPGKTRELNFYNIDNTIYFVDLPGYGYAGVSKEQKSSWGRMIETYLTTRPQLALIMLLVDIRHKPSNDDILMYGWIKNFNLPHIIAATKADKISRSEMFKKIKDIRETLGLEENEKVVPFSSEKKTGKDEIWQLIEEALQA
ncbi:MAG TPA: ribosome biogenesis GTP-binding protein YihA/YsxC [Clostridia bacterium]|nr:ribosome biogenesis GTP-binding protein YihA/YsxC [Clostridia bacterium]